jgi:hypothetical protein
MWVSPSEASRSVSSQVFLWGECGSGVGGGVSNLWSGNHFTSLKGMKKLFSRIKDAAATDG